MVDKTVSINEISYDLTGLEALTWQLLTNGAVKPKDGFHSVCVATVDEKKRSIRPNCYPSQERWGDQNVVFLHGHSFAQISRFEAAA